MIPAIVTRTRLRERAKVAHVDGDITPRLMQQAIKAACERGRRLDHY